MINIFKTKPYAHQERIFDQSKNAEYAAYFMEQRTGKSKLTLDVAAYQHQCGNIDSLLIIAPNGVQRNWITEEIPVHLHDSTNYKCVLWRTGRMTTRQARQDLADLLKHQGLAVLAVNVDALLTAALQGFLKQWFARRKVMSVIDESTDISAPGSARTKVAMRIGRRSAIRRICDGTPVDSKPLGLYSQTQFLHPGLLGCPTYLSFKGRYGEWETKDVGQRNRPCPACDGMGQAADGDKCERCHGSCFIGKQEVFVLKNYRNLDELRTRLNSFSYRVLRTDCADLPPKIYEKRFFELTQDQRRIYEELKHQFQTELAGQTISAAMVLTRYLRLQQVSSNFVAIDGQLSLCAACQGEGCDRCQDQGMIGQAKRIEPIGARNPRLETLCTVLEPLRGQGIIWARFQHDVEQICRTIDSTVRYDGTVSNDDRLTALKDFQAGQARYLVGNPHAGGRGLDLAMADHCIYYSHDWSLRWRNQSEDRAQSLRKRDSVLYIDLIAEHTIDERIIRTLREGKELSALVLGDHPF